MILFFIVGVAFSIVGVFMLLDAYLFRKKAVQVSGRVIAYEKSQTGNSNSVSYAPVIAYEMDHKRYQFMSDISSTAVSYDIDEEVQVLVLGNKHSSARLRRNDRLALALAFLLMGIVPVIVYVSELTTIDAKMTAMVLALFFVMVGTFALLIFSKVHREKKEKRFSYEVNRDGAIGHELSQDVETASKVLERTKPSSRVYALSIIIGLFMLLSSLYWGYKVHKNIAHAVHAEGVIIDKSSSYSDDTLVYAPVVAYRPYTQEAVRFTSKWSSSSPSWHVGDKVDVLYSPNGRFEAIIDRGIWNYAVQIIIGSLGLLVILSSFWLWRKHR